MKTTAVLVSLLLMAASLLAVDATTPTPQEEVKAAAKKLAAKDNYSWRTTFEIPDTGDGMNFKPGPNEGKTEKGGYTWLVLKLGDNTTKVALKEGKGAFTTPDGEWISLADAAKDDGSGPNPVRFLAMVLQNYKAPAAEVEHLVELVKDLKKADDAYTGELTEDGARELLTFRRRSGGQEGPKVTNPKGSVKIWITDGVISKFETKIKGTMTFNDNDIAVDRTTTNAIKDIDKTKVEIPEAAKAKAS